MLSVADEKVLLCQCRLYVHIIKWLPQWRESVHQWQHAVTNVWIVKHLSLFSGILWTEYGTMNDTNNTVISSPELTFSELQKLCGLFNLLLLHKFFVYFWIFTLCQFYSLKVFSPNLKVVFFLSGLFPFSVYMFLVWYNPICLFVHLFPVFLRSYLSTSWCSSVWELSS